jgi:DNA polymerase-3 subunit beta
VGRAVSGRPTHPILANVLLNAVTGQLTLTGYDLSLAIETTLIAVVDEPGEITLPARLFGEIVSKLPAGTPVTLSLGEADQVEISSTSGSYSISGLPANDYPDLPGGAVSSLATIDAGPLRHALGSTLYSCATDESKQILTGAHLAADGEELTIAATDGHRLAVSVADLPPGAPQKPFAATIPARALREVERLLGRAAGDQAICLSVIGGYARIQPQNGPVLITRTIDGQYPNYGQLIPGEFTSHITTSREDLIAAISRAAVLADLGNGVLRLVPGSLDLTVRADAQDVGRGSEVLAATVEGNAPTIAFNAKYLLEALRAHSSEEVTLRCNTPTTPAVIAGDAGVTALVMPVQVREG